MTRILSIFTFLIVSNMCFSQKTLFETLKVDKTTKVIGRYPQYDKSKTYEEFNFIIEDSTTISDFIKTLKLGDEVPNSFETPNFEITVIKNHKEIGVWTINPKQKSAMTHDGQTYKFDLNQIAKLNQSYPFEYNFEIKKFDNKSNFEKYLVEQKKDINFLFDYSPRFKYDGSFEIEFQKSSKYPNPKAISTFLKPYIEKIVTTEEYTLVYIVNEKNLNNREQYTMTIQCSKKLYDKLKIEGLENQNWKPIIEEAYFFYKK